MKLKEIIGKSKEKKTIKLVFEIILKLIPIVFAIAGLILFSLCIVFQNFNLFLFGLLCWLICGLIVFMKDDDISVDYRPFDKVRYKPTNEEGIVKRVHDGSVIVILMEKPYTVLCNPDDLENLTKKEK